MNAQQTLGGSRLTRTKAALRKALIRSKMGVPISLKRPLLDTSRHVQRLWWEGVYRMAVHLNVRPDYTAFVAPCPRPLSVVWVRRAAVDRYFHTPRRLLRERWGLGEDWWGKMTINARNTIFRPPVPGELYEIIHETVRALFIDGQHYRSTSQYQAMMAAVAVGERKWSYGCNSAEGVDAYFERLLAAFQSMSEAGYRTQRRLGGAADDEIALYVTREGRLCQGSIGSHRIRIAELLGIEWIPAVVRGLHTGWLRDLCSEFDLPAHEAVDAWMRVDGRFRHSASRGCVAHVGEGSASDRYRVR